MIKLNGANRICMTTILTFCLFFLMAPIAGAAEPIQDNLSASDLIINQSLSQNNSSSVTVQDMEKIATEVAQQKEEADAKVMNRIIQEATMDTQPSDSIMSTYYMTGRDQSHGGSGAGYSDSYWETFLDVNKNGSLAEIYGSKWGKGWGWIYYTPSESRTYTIGANYNLTGRIVGGNLNIKLIVTDTSNGSSNEQTCFSATSGYFDNIPKSSSKSFYLTSGHRYAITWEANTEASAVASAAMSDFLNTELDGTKRNITFNYFTVN